MTTSPTARRAFLAESSRIATAGWLALQLPWLTSLAGCAGDAAPTGEPFVHLTPAEGRAMAAFAAQIIPSDGGAPGAEEAGAVQFVDRALGAPFFAAGVPVIRAGLAELDARARGIGGAGGFAALGAGQQESILRQMEHGAFFVAARTLVLIGTFADPSHGGNRDMAGWALVGIDPRPSYSAPFGYYDSAAGAA